MFKPEPALSRNSQQTIAKFNNHTGVSNWLCVSAVSRDGFASILPQILILLEITFAN